MFNTFFFLTTCMRSTFHHLAERQRLIHSPFSCYFAFRMVGLYKKITCSAEVWLIFQALKTPHKLYRILQRNPDVKLTPNWRSVLLRWGWGKASDPVSASQKIVPQCWAVCLRRSSFSKPKHISSNHTLPKWPRYTKRKCFVCGTKGLVTWRISARLFDKIL